MDERKTPDWLIETQNKSWEPEILISGITLTFLFFLPEYIYNFYGMLIQEYGLRHVVGNSLYNITIIILTGLKVILILHLILRGVWTGFVGLSYVYPEGVKKERMKRPKNDIVYRKPEEYVITLEKICSLLFSFIFSSLIFVIGFFLMLVPITLLYVFGLEQSIIRLIILFGILPLTAIFIVFLVILSTKKNTWKIEEKIENSIFTNILNTYCTNIGAGKTLMIFALYFAFSWFMSFSYISDFDFDNDLGVETVSKAGVVELDKDSYHDLRNADLRISRGAIDRFDVEGVSLRLSVGFYREDLFTVKYLRDEPARLKELKIERGESDISLETIIRISIDGEMISGLSWHLAEEDRTGQRSMVASIPVDALSRGRHRLKIDKIYWVDRRKKPVLIEDWDVIPFETSGAAAGGLFH
jgi:hypothetical protein